MYVADCDTACPGRSLCLSLVAACRLRLYLSGRSRKDSMGDDSLSEIQMGKGFDTGGNGMSGCIIYREGKLEKTGEKGVAKCVVRIAGQN